MGDDIKPTLDVGDLGKPADTLVKKISKGVGGLFQPWQVKRTAKAEAEAALIKASADIEIGELQRRAVHRFIEEESRHQANMERVAGMAIALLQEGAEPDDVDDDWITNFFDKCRIVSDERMQVLWSKILAGECNEPDSFSRRAVNYVSDMGQEDLEMFETLLRFAWRVDLTANPLVFDIKEPIYGENGLDADTLMALNNIGLIRFSLNEIYNLQGLSPDATVEYDGRVLPISAGAIRAGYINVGQVLLTSVGHELSTLCQGAPVDGYFDFAKAFVT